MEKDTEVWLASGGGGTASWMSKGTGPEWASETSSSSLILHIGLTAATACSLHAAPSMRGVGHLRPSVGSHCWLVLEDPSVGSSPPCCSLCPARVTPRSRGGLDLTSSSVVRLPSPVPVDGCPTVVFFSFCSVYLGGHLWACQLPLNVIWGGSGVKGGTWGHTATPAVHTSSKRDLTGSHWHRAADAYRDGPLPPSCQL